MKLAWKIFGSIALLLVTGILITQMQGSAAAQTATPDQTVYSSAPVTPAVSRPVRDITPSKIPVLNREINPMLNPHRFSPDLGIPGSQTTSQDPLAALSQIETGFSPTPLFQFEGLGTDGFTPPDTMGEVGPNHYVQMVNISFAIFDKSGNVLQPDTPFNNLFTGSGLTACESNNDGDPVVVYDELADRWLLSQFVIAGDRMCIAISQTADPTGAYWLYQFTMPDFPDYFKFGVWPDAYYMTTNTGFPNQYYAYAFDRVNMLAGNAATFQFSANHPNFMMPADLDGSTPPPAGSPGYFYTMLADGYPDHPAGVDRLAFYEFDVDWATPGNTTFTMVDEIPIADYNYTVCGFFVGNCIPQAGTAQTLDSLSYWPMWRFGYRNLGSYEALVGNFTVDVNGADRAAIRWFELRDSGAGWDLHQEGTHAPDTDHRWMGSIAMDGSGNIALGYSVSSSTTIPSIRYATRLASDPLGTLQAEVNVITGGSQTSGATRWGDYSAMSVDPADDCTFWYTNEYHDVNASAFDWNTRIVVFRIPECSGALFPDFSLTADPTTYETCTTTPSVDYNITVSSIMSFTDQVDLSVLGNPAGTTATFTVDPVTPPGSSVLTVGNLGAAVAGSYNIDIVGTAPTSTHTTTVGLDLYTAAPGTVTLTSPADGATSVGLAPTLTWTADANATDYYVEVATDMAFSNIVFTDTVAATSVNLSGLSATTTYYWRVTPNNICGAGTTSAIFAFTTATLYCGAVGSLPDDPDQSFTLNIADAGEITDLDVSILADHTWVGDTTFTLVHQNTGTSVTMIDRPGRTTTGFGCANDNIDVMLDDEGTDGPVENQCAANPALFGSPTPNNPLSAFDGEDLSGTWLLQYSDGAGGDTGTLTEWCLVPTYIASASDVTLSAVTTAQNADAGTTITYTIDVENTGSVSDTYDLTVNSSEGWTVTVNPTSVELEVAESTSAVVSVEVPANAVAGTVDTTTATATSQSDPLVNDTLDLVTTVNEPEIAVTPTEMEATVTAETTADQTLTIWNMGGSNLDWDIAEDAGRGPVGNVFSAIVRGNGSADASTAAELVGTIAETSVVAPAGKVEIFAPTAVLYDNGSLVNSPGTGPAGADESLLQDTSLNMGIFGFGHQTTANNSMADDFVIPAGEAWIIDTVTFYAYQTGSTTTSTITGYNYDLYDGPPNAGGTLIFSGNTIVSSVWSGIYRGLESAPGATNRPIMATTVDFGGLELSAGTYWLEWQAAGSLGSGPWAPAITVDGQTTTGNGLQNQAGTWSNAMDVGQQGLPFIIEGSLASCNTDVPWLSVSPLSGTTAGGGSSDVTVTYDATGYTAGVYTGTLCVNSNDPVNPQITVPVTMTVSTVGVDVGPDAALSGAPGETVTYTVAITNTGVSTDTFDLSLAGSTWITELSVTDITLMAGEMGSFDVTVEVPAGAWAGDWDAVTVMATSQADNGISDWAELTTTAEAVYGFDWSADTTGHTGEAGETVTYTISLTNTGNTTDTFNISLAGHSWTTTPSHNSMMLAPGESADFTVSVTIDAGAAHPDTDTTTLTVTSAGDGSVTDNVALTTSVEEPVVPANPVIYLPMIMKP